MKYNFITIEREYGSGGTIIAQKTAEKCGIACYGREILEGVSKKYSLPIEKIEKYEENVTNSLIYSMYMVSQMTDRNSAMLAREGQMYMAEQDVIKELAAKGPAIFLGHCAGEALSDRRGVVNVFIHSSNEDKLERIVNDYKVDSNVASNVARHFNKKRANYYQANTGRKWSDLYNYDVVLDSGKLGIEGCVKVLKSLIFD